MKDISDIIKEYRLSHNYSLRDFAAKCGVSHSYINMLESRKNSKTGEAIVPSVNMLKKIAAGMGMTLHDLFSKCQDMPITLGLTQIKAPGEDTLSEGEKILIDLFRQIPPDQQAVVLAMIRAALDNLR